MNVVLQPWQLLFLIVAGWVNRQQQQVIEYLRMENQVLREKLGKRRIFSTAINANAWPSKAKSSAASCSLTSGPW